MIYAKILFGIFLAAVTLVLLFGKVNGDRGFAMAILIVACVCQMLFGPVSNRPDRKRNEVLEFYPQRRQI